MQKKLLWGAAVLFTTLVVIAIVLWSTADQDEGPSNTLGPQETAEGWVLLFDGETTKGWDIPSPFRKRLLVVGSILHTWPCSEGHLGRLLSARLSRRSLQAGSAGGPVPVTDNTQGLAQAASRHSTGIAAFVTMWKFSAIRVPNSCR